MSVLDNLSYRCVYSFVSSESAERRVDEFDKIVLRSLEYLIRGESVDIVINLGIISSDLDYNVLFNYLLNEGLITDRLSARSLQLLSKVFTIPVLNRIWRIISLKLLEINSNI